DDATDSTAHYDPEYDHGLWEFRDPTRPDVQYPSRGNLHHYGRQRLWQEYAAAPSHRAHAARPRGRAVRWRELLGGPTGGARPYVAALWGAVPERGVVEFHDPGRKRRPAPGGVH